MKDDTTQKEEASSANEVQQQQVGLGISDLRIFKEVIDVASARGAFKADEFATIGDAYSRLNLFLQTVDANAIASEASDDDVEETDVEETDVEETDVEETDVEETDVEETDEG
jgi:hypothetical protein